jgi:hypothetical protein
MKILENYSCFDTQTKEVMRKQHTSNTIFLVSLNVDHLYQRSRINFKRSHRTHLCICPHLYEVKICAALEIKLVHSRAFKNKNFHLFIALDKANTQR